MMGMKPTILAAVLALVSSNVSAFSTAPLSPKKAFLTKTTPLAMSSEEDGTMISSVNKKQIVYDENTGRFFESNADEADCIPDEEFCVVDKDSGAMIRLTVEEKERIFLDALQVSGVAHCYYCSR